MLLFLISVRQQQQSFLPSFQSLIHDKLNNGTTAVARYANYYCNNYYDLDFLVLGLSVVRLVGMNGGPYWKRHVFVHL